MARGDAHAEIFLELRHDLFRLLDAAGQGLLFQEFVGLHVEDAVAHGLLAFVMRLQEGEPLFPFLRLFETQVRRRFLHLCPAGVHQLTGAAAEQLADLLDLRLVFLRAEEAFARTCAFFEMVVQAAAQLAPLDLLGGERVCADA